MKTFLVTKFSILKPETHCTILAVPDKKLASWSNHGDFWLATIVSRCQSFTWDRQKPCSVFRANRLNNNIRTLFTDCDDMFPVISTVTLSRFSLTLHFRKLVKAAAWVFLMQRLREWQLMWHLSLLTSIIYLSIIVFLFSKVIETQGYIEHKNDLLASIQTIEIHPTTVTFENPGNVKTVHCP